MLKKILGAKQILVDIYIPEAQLFVCYIFKKKTLCMQLELCNIQEFKSLEHIILLINLKIHGYIYIDFLINQRWPLQAASWRPQSLSLPYFPSQLDVGWSTDSPGAKHARCSQAGHCAHFSATKAHGSALPRVKRAARRTSGYTRPHTGHRKWTPGQKKNFHYLLTFIHTHQLKVKWILLASNTNTSASQAT